MSSSSFINSISSAAVKIVSHYEKLDFAYNAGQAFYTHKASESIPLYSKLDSLKLPLFIADIGSFFANVSHVLYKAEKNYKLISRLSCRLSGATAFVDAAVIAGFATVVASFAIGYLAVYFINKSYKTSPAISQGIDHGHVEFNRPGSEKFKQLLYVCRAMMNVALAILCPLNPFFVASATLEVYSLMKITKRKWIEIKKEVACHIFDGYLMIADKIRVIYSFLMHKANLSKQTANLKEKEICSICQDDTSLPDAHFCQNHTFHPKCLISMLESHARNFGSGFKFKRRKIHETRHYSNGVYTGSSFSASYSIDASRRNLPSCPNCREQANSQGFKVQIHDLRYGWSVANIDWVA